MQLFIGFVLLLTAAFCLPFRFAEFGFAELAFGSVRRFTPQPSAFCLPPFSILQIKDMTIFIVMQIFFNKNDYFFSQ
jgi:hypothetical protein